MKAAVALLALLLIVACGPDTAGGEGNNTTPQRGNSLKIGLEYEPWTLDPLYADSRDELQVLRQMFEPLVEIDAHFDIRPLLATSWSFRDPTTLVLQLRRGVRFQNGEPFDAAAARYSLERARTRPELQDLESVSTSGSGTLVLHLKRADPVLLYGLAGPAGMMVSPVAAASQGAEAEFGRNPVVAGTGPFVFQFWRRGYHIILERNPTYWGRQPYVDQLDFTQSSPGPALDRLRAGDLDVVETLDRSEVTNAESDRNLDVSTAAGFTYEGLVLNQGPGGAFADPARRLALTALDQPGVGPLTPRSWAYRHPPAPPSPSAAHFGFSLKVDSEPQHMDLALQLRSKLASSGIDMAVQVEDPDSIRSELRSHQFEAALVELGGTADPDGDLYPEFHTGGPDNFGQFSDSRVDGDLDTARSIDGQGLRAELYQDAVGRLLAAGAFVFLDYPPVYRAAGRWVHGLQIRSDGTLQLASAWVG